MAIGRRGREQQQELWTATQDLAAGPGHVFYDKLNGLLAAKGFDLFAEELCEPFYAAGGKLSIPPGVYFRMPAISDSEEIDSQRGRHSRLVPPAGNSSHMKACDILAAVTEKPISSD